MKKLLIFTTLLFGVATASASAEPVWRIDSAANTTALPGGTITYYVEIVNVGSSEADGSQSQIKTTIAFPSGVTGVSGIGRQPSVGPVPTCTATDGVSPVTGQGTIQCVTESHVTEHGDSASSLRYTIVAQVDPGVPIPSTLTTSFNTSGGGAIDPAATVDPTRIDSTPAFGVDAFDGQLAADQTGAPLTQAGAHPYAITTAIDFNTVSNSQPLIGNLWPAEPVKDGLVDLPPGLIGSVASVDQCTLAQLANTSFSESRPLCPTTSQIGTTVVRTNGFTALFKDQFGPVSVYNMVPSPDAPAKFGFNVSGVIVTLTARLRSNGDYGISIDGNNIPEGLAVAGSTFTFWGVPSDPSHDRERGCPGERYPSGGGRTCPSGAPARAFLRMPTSCAAGAGQDGLVTRLSTDSWDHPGARDANGEPVAGDASWQHAIWVTHAAPGYPYPASDFGPHLLPTGCDKVPFTPTLTMTPTGAAHANSPTPFTVDLNLPQSDEPSSIGEADLKKAVVTLPAGVRVSPSSADGLAACSPLQIALHSTSDPTCPDASKIGSLTITSPLITQQLTGSVYLASQNENPFSSLLAIYLVAKGAGVTVKVSGHIEADPTTGQLTTIFDDQPQLPFSNLHLQFNGGPRAPLVTPPSCGTYTTHALLSSWARSESPVASDSSFTVSQNSDGSPCSPASFSPTLAADTTNPLAGAFSPFNVRVTRGDHDQELGSLTVETPPGVLADLATVTRCGEPDAANGTCPEASRIGTVVVGSGPGSNPFYVNSGRAYLTGPYKGAPFGLTVVVPAVAGPFNLGNVIVRNAIFVDPRTLAVRVVSDPLPTILQGIPLQVRDIRVLVDRPGFFFNPTSCEPKEIHATVASTTGVVAQLASHFQVAECRGLAFHPRFSVSTSGRTSKADGASLHVRVSAKEGPGSSGSEANIAKVDVSLPLALPSRLTTLQKACTSAQFASNPAGCPEASFVGTAVARSPVLASALSGPAILVSHGGEAFPDLVIVLQGEGIRLDLVGNTRIKKGVTFSRFETVPDAPVSSFDLDLPRGPHSALTANRGLCGKSVTVKKRVSRRVRGRVVHGFKRVRQLRAASLLMPTTIIGQNGAVLRQATRIAVTGCASPTALKKKTTNKKKAKTGRRQ